MFIRHYLILKSCKSSIMQKDSVHIVSPSAFYLLILCSHIILRVLFIFQLHLLFNFLQSLCLGIWERLPIILEWWNMITSNYWNVCGRLWTRYWYNVVCKLFFPYNRLANAIAIMTTTYYLRRLLIHLHPNNKPLLCHLTSFQDLWLVPYIKDQQWKAWISTLPFILYLPVGWNRLIYSCTIKKFSCYILILEYYFWNSWLHKWRHVTLGSRAEREAVIKTFQNKGYCCMFCGFSGL